MSKYIMRLDDACPRHDRDKWQRMEELLNAYGVKPIVGIIPDCRDPQMEQYPEDPEFWDRARAWQSRGWAMALHGWQHVYVTREGGLNPVHQRSEFAGLSLEKQKEKIAAGMEVFNAQGIKPVAFIAPSHTFDKDTLRALLECTDIRSISDTVARAPYNKYGFTFVPQQTGRARKLNLDWVTFCYHPNVMGEEDFLELEGFLRVHEGEFVPYPKGQTKRREDIGDKLLRLGYFTMRHIRRKLNGK